MKYPYLQYPLEEEIEVFVEETVDKYFYGDITQKEYHVTLGKALAYAEVQFITDRISRNKAQEIINEIELKIE